MLTVDGYDIVAKYGLPREMVSCPDCGRIYGHHNTKVCENCECCSKCCTCLDSDKKLAAPMKFVSEHT